jgi:hypothetical protein
VNIIFLAQTSLLVRGKRTLEARLIVANTIFRGPMNWPAQPPPGQVTQLIAVSITFLVATN